MWHNEIDEHNNVGDFAPAGGLFIPDEFGVVVPASHFTKSKIVEPEQRVHIERANDGSILHGGTLRF